MAETTARTPPAPLLAAITETLLELAALPSVSGAETAVRAYLDERLRALGLRTWGDAAGNLLARVPGMPAPRDAEAPLLLNAHMDRVPPGLAHAAVLDGPILRSDGTTNLGADDSAGLAIVLHTVAELRARQLTHPPLLLLFTVGEEVGLVGASAFGPQAARPWAGIVFDNAAAPGAVVLRAATYIAFDVLLRGTGGHPGKQLAGTASAIEIFRTARLPIGELVGGESRVSLGRVEGGTARNAVPEELRAQGEVRTLLEGTRRVALLGEIERAFTEAAAALGGSATVHFDPHCIGYTVDPAEPLLRAYRAEVERRGGEWQPITSFIGSDASALRVHTPVFTVSTGVAEEHTVREWIALPPLAELVETAVALLSSVGASR